MKPFVRFAAMLVGAMVEVRAADTVHFPGDGLALRGVLYRPAGDGPFPAIVMLHGCGGLWRRAGQPTATYESWARHFQAHGYAALLVDSFGPRGEKEICTQAQRAIAPGRERVEDAYAALRWLADRPDVDGGRIDLLGWSNGGTTVLHAVSERRAGREGPKFRKAVAFYPGCTLLAKTAYHASVPVLIQAGAADDWTPAAACQALVRLASQGRGARVEIDVYEGAHHAFDRVEGTVRRRPNVRNPSAATGWGATVGPNPQAREASLERTTRFLDASP